MANSFVPLADLYFSETPYRPSELNNKKLHLLMDDLEGTFTLHAAAHPVLSHLLTITATTTIYRSSSFENYRVRFDGVRVDRIRPSSDPRYDFEADLRSLPPLRQDPKSWNAVKADFEVATKHLQGRMFTTCP